ncbi:MAG TPA: hypothetical protein PLQ42_01210, partial [Candidatus Hydrogenedentes bacterium]|nr:hypothetical protein [Candidatus Hydrogenedentota bacterium]
RCHCSLPPLCPPPPGVIPAFAGMTEGGAGMPGKWRECREVSGFNGPSPFSNGEFLWAAASV